VEHADPETGQPLFAGPRVRMGLHWGREGTVVMRQHSITKHKVYAGPAVHITMDVSEAANGGQVLLTDVSSGMGTVSMSPHQVLQFYSRGTLILFNTIQVGGTSPGNLRVALACEPRGAHTLFTRIIHFVSVGRLRSPSVDSGIPYPLGWGTLAGIRPEDAHLAQAACGWCYGVLAWLPWGLRWPGLPFGLLLPVLQEQRFVRT
jgi:hypothetical protein